MRLGGSVLADYQSPKEWLGHIKNLDFSAVIAPFSHKDSLSTIDEYMTLIKENDLILGEVGAWSNPMSTNEAERLRNIEYCQKQLAMADEVGAYCCVNIVGGTGELWDGCYKENYHNDVYALIVESIQKIIDGVSPKRTFYTIEPMPWMVPDSPDAYLKLLKDVNREGLAVHMDYTNMINQPQRFIQSKEFIEECFEKLGPYIKSVHLKDLSMTNELPCVIKEVPPGQGKIDMGHVLKLTSALGKNMTAYVEHFDQYHQYKESVAYLRTLAKNEQIDVT